MYFLFNDDVMKFKNVDFENVKFENVDFLENEKSFWSEAKNIFPNSRDLVVIDFSLAAKFLFWR